MSTRNPTTSNFFKKAAFLWWTSPYLLQLPTKKTEITASGIENKTQNLGGALESGRLECESLPGPRFPE